MSLLTQIAKLDEEGKKAFAAETRSFHLAAHAELSEKVFQEEVGLIRARRHWIEEEKYRLAGQLADIQRLTFNPEAVGALRSRLEERLRRATPEDKRFVLESLGTNIIAYPDGSWDIEIELPGELRRDLQIVQSRPESIFPGNTGWLAG